MDLGLSGKVALVTGSTRGIGFAIAKGLGDEGAKVCICGRGQADLNRAQQELQQKGIDSLALAVDLNDEKQARSAIDQCVKHFGALDILVNNAGGSLGTKGIDQTTTEQMTAVFDLNFMSAYWCAHQAIEPMTARGGGVILNISSISGRELCSSSAYGAAKAAMIAMTKEMSVTLASKRIRVNSLAPGSILFDGGSWDKRLKSQPERIEKMLREELPWGRFGTPEEVANAAVFLVSSKASWVSGACLTVDGAQGRAL